MEIFNPIKTNLPKELFKLIQSKLFDVYGITLDDSKIHFVKNRLIPRLKELKIISFEAYYKYIKENSEELINALVFLTTGESSFFRDELQWKDIEIIFKEYIEQYFINSHNDIKDNYIHIWSAACSKGYEPYTIAIILRELFGNSLDRFNIKILASDVNIDSLKIARQGFYTDEELKGVDSYIIDKYFYKGALNNQKGYFISNDIKKIISFAKINLVENFKFKKKFDFVFLKNVLIYFPIEIKIAVTKNITEFIKDNGYLVLGTSENLFNKDINLKLIKNHIYKKTHDYNNLQNNVKKTVKNSKFEIQILKNYEKKFLNLGEYFVSSEPLCISTVLGSCISVCLFDEITKIGAMNHFMLPYIGNTSDPYKKFELEKYGFWAMEFMLNDMLKKGAKKKDIKAKIFGGANISETESSKSVAKSNIEFALSYLNNEKIPIISQDIGKNYARRIYFLTDTGKVFLIKIKTAISEQQILKNELLESENFIKKIDKTVSKFEKFD